MTHVKFKPLLSGFIIILLATILVAPVQASEPKAEGGDKSSAEIYIKVPPFAVSMYHQGQPRGNMTISLVLKVVDKKKRDQVREYLPRLSSAYVIEANRLSYDFFDVTRPVSVAMLGNALQRVTNKLLGYKGARVLISGVIVNKR